MTFYANCPIIWQSKLQTTIALSTTEAKYVALSSAMRDVIYFMNLIDKMKNFGIHLPGVPKPITTCRVFEDNVGAIVELKKLASMNFKKIKKMSSWVRG